MKGLPVAPTCLDLPKDILASSASSVWQARNLRTIICLVLTGASVYVNVSAALIVLLALPLYIGAWRRTFVEKNNLVATFLIGLALVFHGGFQTLLRLSPHAMFTGYDLGWEGGPGEKDSSVYIYDLGYPPGEDEMVFTAPNRNLHLSRHTHPVPDAFWQIDQKLLLKCDYRKWDLEITHIEAIPTPEATLTGSRSWSWDSDSEARAGCLLEAFLGLVAVLGVVFLFRMKKRAAQLSTIRPVCRFPNPCAVRIYSSAALLAVSWCAFVRASDHWFQHKAESLLRDIQNLELRKSTWKDAERIRTKFARNAKTDTACSPAHCDLEIGLVEWDIYSRIGKSVSKFDLIAIKAVRVAGGRWGSVQATVRIRGGVVWGKDFGVIMAHPQGYALMAAARTVSRFEFQPDYAGIDLHPNVRFGQPMACTFCKELWAKVTPYASSEEFRDAFAFDLSCIASTLRRCTEMNQIMPVATRRIREKSRTMAHSLFLWAPHASLTPFGRDARNIAIMETARIYPQKLDSQGYATQIIDYRMSKELKGQFDRVLYPATYYLGKPNGEKTSARMPPALHQQVLAFWDDEERMPMIAPLTAANLQEVREGIIQDAVDIPTGGR